VKNLAESIAVQSAVNELIVLEEQPRGPSSIDKTRRIFDIFSSAENQNAINKIVEAHFCTIAKHACPPL